MPEKDGGTRAEGEGKEKAAIDEIIKC